MTTASRPTSRPGLHVTLSAPTRTVWAKHDRDSAGWRHMEDSAAVAGLLWDSWLPAGVRRVISASLPGGEDDGRRLAVWLAGAHDIGKATPAFPSPRRLLCWSAHRRVERTRTNAAA
ncbi:MULTISPECIES: HD domain-containing protein [unclassified Streptomyces]|uniref:HD domain-containing protein n=1 Tax=unclassified Streptomyces TaxID=2593676 RepID=UPI000DB55464|nr:MULTISPECIES: HD domain-containing protein [unclassified Streptomyces]PZT79778.1 hypothetical protein DNK55_09460 [Streptomyces sp. AC1-42T]